jgi:hypothetical protein
LEADKEVQAIRKEERKKDLRKKITEAQQSWEAFEKAFAIRKTQPPKAGDSFHFNLGKEVFMSWVLTHQHPDDPDLWFLVPEDGTGNYMVGSTDIWVPGTDPGGPTVIRAGRVLQARMESVLAHGERISFISDEYVNRVHHVLHCLATGKRLDITPEQEECDFDPDYEDYMDEISVLCNALDELLWGKEPKG